MPAAPGSARAPYVSSLCSLVACGRVGVFVGSGVSAQGGAVLPVLSSFAARARPAS